MPSSRKVWKQGDIVALSVLEVAEAQMVGLMSLVPQICDAVSLPVIATGGIADARGVAAALILGASAVQIGTGFLRSPEAKINAAYADKIGQTEAHETGVTRAFSGRPARGIRNRYVAAAASAGAPLPAPYPVQRGFTRAMREDALRAGDADRMQMWAGQSARLATAEPAALIARHRLWGRSGAISSLNPARSGVRIDSVTGERKRPGVEQLAVHGPELPFAVTRHKYPKLSATVTI